jgi:ribosomal protein S18 acetylase RimI-like enzyme
MSHPEPSNLSTFRLSLEVRLRACTEADLPALEWGDQYTHHRELIHEAFGRQRRGELAMIVADAGSFPIGQVWVDLHRRRARGAGLLQAVRVLPWLTGRGVGAQLVGAAEQLLRTRGFAAAEIFVETENVRARRLYERLGYVVVDRIREAYTYTPPGGDRERIALDEWILRKTLASDAGDGPDGGPPVPTEATR